MTAIATFSPSAVNRAFDPSFENDAMGLPSSNTNFSGGFDTTNKVVGTRSYMTTRTVGTGNQISTPTFTPTSTTSPYRILATPNEVITVSCRAMTDQVNWRGRLDLSCRTAAGAGTTLQGTLVTLLPAMQWVVLSNTFTVTATAAYVSVVGNAFLLGGSVVLGERGWWDGLMVTSGSTVEPYFDGDTPGCEWNGAANASTSIRRAVQPWSVWDGTTAQPLTVSGVWDGSAVQPATLTDISVIGS